MSAAFGFEDGTFGARPNVSQAQANTRLEALYQQMLPLVYGYARGRLREADAEDVTAEVFRRALQRLQDDPTADLNTSWFVTVARNLVIDDWRRSMRWNDRMELLRRETQRVQTLREDQAADRVLDALDRLSPEHRIVLVLRYVEQRTSREIAEALGRSPRAIDSLIVRARAALAAAFEAVET